MRFKHVIHFVIISVIILISVILNSYTVVYLTREISRKKSELRRLRWEHDRVLYQRYALWPKYLRDVIDKVR